MSGEFPGGLVVRIRRFHCRGPGFNPWSASWGPVSRVAWSWGLLPPRGPFQTPPLPPTPALNLRSSDTPPPVPHCPLPLFLRDFSSWLPVLVSRKSPVMILSHFNIHLAQTSAFQPSAPWLPFFLGFCLGQSCTVRSHPRAWPRTLNGQHPLVPPLPPLPPLAPATLSLCWGLQALDPPPPGHASAPRTPLSSLPSTLSLVNYYFTPLQSSNYPPALSILLPSKMLEL